MANNTDLTPAEMVAWMLECNWPLPTQEQVDQTRRPLHLWLLRPLDRVMMEW